MTISYREDFGLFWPDWDKKAEKNHAYILKHLPTMDFAISQCKKFDVCVQAGGHVGIWPNLLSGFFKKVYTFEPDPDLFNCLFRNVETHPTAVDDVLIQEAALSDINSIAHFKRSSSSGSGCIDPSGIFHVEAITLDSLNLAACDAIFLDIEGSEIFALRGASETIREFRPIIQTEELGAPNNQIDVLLTQLHGYRRHPEKQGKDVIYLPC